MNRFLIATVTAILLILPISVAADADEPAPAKPTVTFAAPAGIEAGFHRDVTSSFRHVGERTVTRRNRVDSTDINVGLDSTANLTVLAAFDGKPMSWEFGGSITGLTDDKPGKPLEYAFIMRETGIGPVITNPRGESLLLPKAWVEAWSASIVDSQLADELAGNSYSVGESVDLSDAVTGSLLGIGHEGVKTGKVTFSALRDGIAIFDFTQTVTINKPYQGTSTVTGSFHVEVATSRLTAVKASGEFTSTGKAAFGATAETRATATWSRTWSTSRKDVPAAAEGAITFGPVPAATVGLTRTETATFELTATRTATNRRGDTNETDLTHTTTAQSTTTVTETVGKLPSAWSWEWTMTPKTTDGGKDRPGQEPLKLSYTIKENTDGNATATGPNGKSVTVAKDVMEVFQYIALDGVTPRLLAGTTAVVGQKINLSRDQAGWILGGTVGKVTEHSLTLSETRMVGETRCAVFTLTFTSEISGAVAGTNTGKSEILVDIATSRVVGITASGTHESTSKAWGRDVKTSGTFTATRKITYSTK
jgi:hypothetical protein